MDFIPEYYKKSVLILGCGNVLFGDDGFGPAVIEHLQKNYQLPEDVCSLDVGTGVREILFTVILSEKKPKKIILIDAVDVGRKPGDVFELPIDEIPENKISDFSLHQLPTSNLLRELKKHCKVEIKIISAQVENIPEAVRPGLSKSLLDAIPKGCELVLKLLRCMNGQSLKKQ